MIIEGKKTGVTVAIRSVTEEDAEFILKIRNDPTITEYLPALDVSVEDQKRWIRKQQAGKDSYYFLIENKCGQPLGTISIYNIDSGCAETGRFCSYGNFVQNTEAVVLFYDFIFYDLHYDLVKTWVYKDNKPIIKMNTQTGFEWTEEKKAQDGRLCCIGFLTPDAYEKKMSRIKRKFKTMIIDNMEGKK